MTAGQGRRGSARAALGVLVGAFSALVLIAAAVLWGRSAQYGDLAGRVELFGGRADRPARTANGSLDLLFVATDRQSGRQARSPAAIRIVLVHLSKWRHRAVLVGLPADSLLAVPAHRNAKGNRVKRARHPLTWAYTRGGPDLLARTVEAATGVRLEGYVEVAVPAMLDAVAAAGGLDVCVPVAVTGGKAGPRLPPGDRRLSAAQTGAYLRSTAGGTLAQVRRLQVLAGAVDRTVFARGAAQWPFWGRELLGGGAGAVRVGEGVDADTTRRLALTLHDPYGTAVSVATVPVDGTRSTRDGRVTVWNSRLARYLFDRLRRDATVDPGLFTPVAVGVRPSSVSVRVENGAGVAGLAARAAADLRGVGFKVAGEPGNADRSVGVTTVRYDRRRTRQARALQQAITGARLDRVKRLRGPLVVVVGPGYGGVRPVTYVKGAGTSSAKETLLQVTDPGPCT